MSLNLQTTTVTTSPYTVSASDTLVLVKRTSPSSIVLPVLTGNDCVGKSFYIKDALGTSRVSPITITAPGNKTINGVAFAMLNGNYSHVQLAYDGVNWLTIA